MKVTKFFKNHHEELVMLIALAGFFLIPYLLKSFSPEATTHAGALQVISVSIIAFSIFKSFTWLIISIVWPSIHSYFQNHFVFDFNELTAWQKVRVAVAIYFILFLSLVLLFNLM